MAGAVLAGGVAAGGVPAAMTSLQNCGDTVSSEDSRPPHHCGDFGTVERRLLPVAPTCPSAPRLGGRFSALSLYLNMSSVLDIFLNCFVSDFLPSIFSSLFF